MQQWQKERTPATRRKPEETLQPRQKRQRHQDAQGRLRLALQDPELSIKDMAAALEAQGVVEALFETKVLWEYKMAFAEMLAERMVCVASPFCGVAEV